MKKITFFILTLLATSTFLQAQQDAQFSQYMFNQLFLNPAVAGLDQQNIEMGLIHRSQWAGYSATFDDGSSPSTQVLRLSSPIRIAKSGIGFHLVRDQLGPLTNLELMLSYAYHYKLKNGNTLSMGIRGGIYNQTIDFSKYRPNDENDPLIPSANKENQIKPDFNLGLYYSSEKYFVGASLNHLLKTEFNYGTGININSLDKNLTLLGGANFEVSPTFDVSPSAILKTDFNTASYEISTILTYDGKYFLGGSLRASNALDAGIMILGLNTLEDKNLRITYSIDFVMSGVSAKSPTSHEISIGYKLFSPAPSASPIIRTPRFRF